MAATTPNKSLPPQPTTPVKITRGPAVTTYGDVSGASADGQFTLKYKSATGPAGTATFASPLLVVVPKEGLKGAIFADDGAEVGTAK